MRARVDAERLQAAQVQLLRVARVRLEDDLRCANSCGDGACSHKPIRLDNAGGRLAPCVWLAS